MSSIDTVAVLFTDLVGSTALSSQLRKAVALAREHEVPELERRAAERLDASAGSIA